MPSGAGLRFSGKVASRRLHLRPLLTHVHDHTAIVRVPTGDRRKAAAHVLRLPKQPEYWPGIWHAALTFISRNLHD